VSISSEEVQILEDLRNVDGSPARGVNVTVYGIPWKALLKFGADAGPVRNKAELQQFFEIITERLQRLYDAIV
jgi:kynurenine formamidase